MADLEVVRASEDDVTAFARRRYPDEHGNRLYRDLAEMAPSGAWVARDEGTPIAIGFAHAAEDELFVSELFVEPSFRGQGLGRALLGRVVGDAGDAARAAAVNADDPTAAAFAVQHSIAPVTQLLRIAGSIPREDDLLRLAAGDYRFGVQPVDVASQGSLDGIDREVRGTGRRADHAYFAERATGSAFFLNNEFVGYAYVWPSGRLGPIAVASASYMGQVFGFALAASARTYGASWCTTLLPATNARAARAALRAGLRIESTVTFLRDDPACDFTRYVAFHDLLI
jgi:GNAT superfamily N-acetyltransferase